MNIIEYIIDQNNNIISTTDKEGQGYINKNYFSVISDYKIKHIVEKIFNYVRKTQKSFTTTYYCDKYLDIRLFKMVVSPLQNNKLSIKHFLEQKTTIKDETDYIDIDINIDINNKKISMCAWCNRVKIDNGPYLDFEKSLNILRLLEYKNIPLFSHGICEECENRLNDELSK